MPITELQRTIFDQLNYPNTETDGNPVWTSATPSSAVIAAVYALPVQANDLWSIDLTTDSDALALQALVSGDQWSVFSTWHNTQWKAACVAIHNSTDVIFGCTCALMNQTGFGQTGGPRDEFRSALTAAGITRQPV